MIKIINKYIAWLGVMLGIVGLPMGAGAQTACDTCSGQLRSPVATLCEFSLTHTVPNGGYGIAANLVCNAEICGQYPLSTTQYYWGGMGFYSLPAGQYFDVPRWYFASSSPNWGQPGTYGGLPGIYGNQKFESLTSLDQSGSINLGAYNNGTLQEESVVNYLKNDALLNRHYLFSTYYKLARNSDGGSSIGLEVNLFSEDVLFNNAYSTLQEIKTGISNPSDMFPLLINKSFNIDVQYNTLNLSPWARVGSSTHITNTSTQNYTTLCISPRNLLPNLAEASFMQIDRVELMEDNFKAIADGSSCTAVLGGTDFNMLSDVVIQYTWRKQGDPTVLLQYTVEHQANGTILVNGVANTIIPKLTVPTIVGTVYELSRVIVPKNNYTDVQDLVLYPLTSSVMVSHTPTATIAYHNPAICLGESQNLTASAGVSYAWSNGATTQTTAVTPTVLSTYTVTVTDACGGIATAQTTVDVFDPNTISFTETHTSAGVFTFTISPYSNNFLTNIDFGDNTPPETINSSTISHTYTAGCPRIATLTVTCGTFPVTKTIDIDWCPVPQIGATLPPNTILLGDGIANAPTKLSDLNLPFYQGTSMRWFQSDAFINGTFIIDQDVYIAGRYFGMYPGSEFIIANDIKCTMEGVGFDNAACNTLWKGITVQSGAVLKSTYGYFTHAYRAISAGQGATLSLDNNDFNDNYIGVYLSGKCSVPLISGNKFHPLFNTPFPCRFNGLGDYQPHAFAGIYMEDVPTLNFGVTAFPNTFDDLINGIVAINSTITGARNLTFNRIKNYLDSDDPTAGAAILLLKESSLAANGYIGLSNVNAIKVTDSDMGIYVNSSSASIRNTALYDVRIGVYVENCQAQSVSIDRNYIQATDIGILTVLNAGLDRCHITNNNISIVGAPNAANAFGGIVLAEFGTRLASDNNIQNNNVNVGYGVAGIQVIGAEDINLLGNIINLTQNYNTANQLAPIGIDLGAATGANLRCNYIVSNSAAYFDPATNPNDATIGINITNTAFAALRCNTTDRTFTGISARGAFGGTELTTNSINRHHFGIDFSKSLVLGDQLRNGNTWNNGFYTANTTDFAARHQGVVSQFGRLPGFFIVAGNNAAETPASFLFTEPSATPANWFGTDPGNTATCPTSTDYVCHYFIPLTNPDSLQFKREVAKGQIETAEFNAEMTKWSKRNLYEELKTQPALVSLDTVLANFKDSLDQSFLSGVYEVAKKREDLTKRSSNEAATIQIERTNMETLLGQLTQIDSLARENTANAANTAYYTAQKAQKMAELSVHRNTYESYMESYKAGVSARALTAKAENTTLVTPELYSQNEKIVNEIYLNRFSARASKTVNASDAAIMTAIANQCPMTGGPAVYYARAMRVRTNRAPYNDAAECALRSVAFRQAKPRKASVANGAARSFTLQPNPAKGSSLIVADQAVADDTAVQLVDMLGRVMHTFTLPKGSSSTALDVSTYPAGVYYCRIGNAATPVQVLRLVIAE